MNCAALWPPATDGMGNEWGHWVVLCERVGASFPLKRGFLLMIRGVEVFAAQSHETIIAPKYNDSFVLLHADGTTPPLVFPGSTHAYQLNSKASPDVNHDGVGDVGTIKPGRYVAHARAGKYPCFEVTMPDGSPKLPCYRDLTHTGKLEEGDFTADSILIHWGFDAPKDSDHSSSIGCLTTSGVWLRRLDAEARAHGGAIDLVLGDVDYVLKAAPEREAQANA